MAHQSLVHPSPPLTRSEFSSAHLPVQIPLFTGVPYEFWVSPVVSEALIPHMTIRQILDRLPYLSHLKLIPAQPENPDPCQILVDRSKMTSERIHPFQVLAGMRRYEAAIFREVPTIKAKPDEENPEGKNLKARPTTITSWDVSDKVCAFQIFVAISSIVFCLLSFSRGNSYSQSVKFISEETKADDSHSVVDVSRKSRYSLSRSHVLTLSGDIGGS